jgi:hypothetical protein
MMLLRCGSGCPPGFAVMSVFGRGVPAASEAFFRLTVPTIGLTGMNSLLSPASNSVARENPA